MRIDGREANQLRDIEFTPGILRFPEGSCIVQWGRNRVVCAATVTPGVPNWMAGQGRGWLTAEYSMLPYSSKQRVPRDSGRAKPNSRALEIQRLIGRSLRAAVDLKALGERTITIDCDVLEADGGTRTASITGGFVALALAMQRLRETGQLGQKAVLLTNYVAAVSVGIVEGAPVLDLNYLEDAQAETDMNVVMNAAGEYIEVQGSAEGAPFSRALLDELLALASDGIGQLIERQRQILQLT
mgnify:CR=1 FL=1